MSTNYTSRGRIKQATGGLSRPAELPERRGDKYKDDIHTQEVCGHQYEVGVVVVSTSSQFLELVGPLGDSWVVTCVDPAHSVVFVDGVRVREVDTVKAGTIGHMVLTECVKCQFLKSNKDIVIASPCLLWFGDTVRPTVRGAVGEVVGKEGDMMVVQLEGPPAARTARLVLFYLESIVHRQLVLHTKVLVWAWSRQHQVLSRGVRKFLEGAAVTRV